MYVVSKIEEFLFSSSPTKLVVTLIALTVLKSGVWFMPNLSAQIELAKNPFVNPFADPEAHYLVWNWLGPCIAWLIGATSLPYYFLLHFLFSVLFSVVVAYVCFARLSDRNARIALVLFALLPVSATSYFWVGMDSLTLLLIASAFLVTNSLLWPMVIGLLLGFQHFEQAFVASCLLLLVVVLRMRLSQTQSVSLAWCLALIASVLFGKLLLVLLFDYYGIEVATDRSFWLTRLFPEMVKQVFSHGHYAIWSILALGWVVLIKDLERGKAAIPVLFGLLLASIFLVLVFDQTRVLAIITFPILLVSWLLDTDFLSGLEQRFVSWLLLIWIFVPWAWVLGGVPQLSVLPYNVALVMAPFTDLYVVPDDLAWWPFDYHALPIR